MPVGEWNTNANLNITVDGINIAEGCPAANINGAIRAVMANIRVMYDGLPDLTLYVTKSGGTFITNPTFTGRGGFLHNSNSSNTGGQVFVQATGSGTPVGMVNGDWLAEY